MTSAHQRLGERIRHLRGSADGRRARRLATAGRARPGPRTIVLTCGDYLAIGEHPRVTRAMLAGLRAAPGPSAPGADLPGDHPQVLLGARFARYLDARHGVLHPSGRHAATAALQLAAGPGTPVYLDALAHLSLWSGARAAGADTVCFQHNDLADLRRRVEAAGPGVICVDAVYGTDGSVCPLAGLVEIAEAHGCLLVVDESHAVGVRGPRGGGLVGELGLTGRVDFRTAGLGKAFCARAGLVVCDHPAFAGALGAAASGPPLPAHEVAGLAAALDVVHADGWRRDRVRAASGRLRGGLAALGFGAVDADTQIIALETATEAEAVRLRDELVGRDIFSAALFSSVSPSRTLLRLAVHAGLTDDDVDRVLTACEELTARPATPAPAH
ncbi:aminotransferase class I/II-fold pyridoxal phosphate-dependent enzyme [Actinomadura montaniterrae]|uniref:8-amino-7-oxononanoate synthase n=1 Tax=Actinomadura montaniterrae TaxID=1803903 RepID=A0A6L3VMJ3_9ACTN|nr:aminotransferase class I/II-fold pyridoxal phosphate-dependent enzyme [Actinomadura montaniterrae]KAB2362932.1 aminotransferase class I/II-fold pyridoxal phosphate-dependent enzyme [Actinomadura montaniterrae]